MSRATINDELILGAEPRVDLLPPEVKVGRRAKSVRRRLGALFVAIIVLVGAGSAAASWYAMQSQANLVAAQARTTDLLGQQTTFAEVRQVQASLDTTIAAREFGASTEVDWKVYLGAVRAVLPADVAINTVDVDSTSPLAVYAQPSAPLQAPRVATLQLSLTSPNLPSVPQWLEKIKSLPGYADATPGSITRTETGAYKVDLVMHINSGAYSERFATTEGK